jgi:putative transposase
MVRRGSGQATDALIASAYLSATNTRRVRRALNAAFAGAVGKDEVSRVWRKVKGAWNSRSLAAEPIIRFILDGTIVRVRLDKKSTSISVLLALGVRRDGQKVLLAVRRQAERAKPLGGRRSTISSNADAGARHRRWRASSREGASDALVRRSVVPAQRCAVHKH